MGHIFFTARAIRQLEGSRPGSVSSSHTARQRWAMGVEGVDFSFATRSGSGKMKA